MILVWIHTTEGIIEDLFDSELAIEEYCEMLQDIGLDIINIDMEYQDAS